MGKTFCEPEVGVSVNLKVRRIRRFLRISSRFEKRSNDWNGLDSVGIMKLLQNEKAKKKELCLSLKIIGGRNLSALARRLQSRSEYCVPGCFTF